MTLFHCPSCHCALLISSSVQQQMALKTLSVCRNGLSFSWFLMVHEPMTYNGFSPIEPCLYGIVMLTSQCIKFSYLYQAMDADPFKFVQNSDSTINAQTAAAMNQRDIKCYVIVVSMSSVSVKQCLLSK
ncbi:hypothetical protein SAY87_028469 [Trapa incisa]|uniref:Uncharacterized protein n=1 Tax=Trapa incisa TaxID=236973 RepID=A0AAN7QS26_9MYRT|nr:hypothetical protein SAY87_028469 [Trapa incisa]